ncbi:MAG: translation elongation factor 4 [bacterium]|nr:translation elongation factor 4 [bacterium]
MQDHIRNFCIIAHIDHGKSTLADRFLDITGTVEQRQMKEQYLDQMDLEREKGITIKMQPVRMIYNHAETPNSKSQTYMLNLIDTPGHADFSYEVSRSLAAVEGAILLVDATKGVQAQTLAHYTTAKAQNLVIVPAINKIDAPLAQTEEVKAQVSELMGIDPKEIVLISAKEGTNVKELLERVIEKVPPPRGEENAPLRALIFDSKFDAFRGVLAYVRIVDGNVKGDERAMFLGTQEACSIKEVGIFLPGDSPVDRLSTGEIGYIATGVKEANRVRIGDTISIKQSRVQPLAGYQIPKPMVFASLYPMKGEEFDLLKDSLSRLHLNDPSLTYEIETKEALGRGFRCGFLGILHSEIVTERVRREYGIEVIISRPSVEFRVIDSKGKEVVVRTPSDFPNESRIRECVEPWARLEVLCPTAFFSAVLKILEQLEGKQLETRHLGEQTLLLVYEVPLREIVGDLYERLKSGTQGWASMDYEVADWKKADLVKLEFRIAGNMEEAFASIVPREHAQREGKKIVEKLRDLLPPQQFDVPLQAMLGGKVIARETIRARRKDVTAPLYGGDITRKRKLLDRQKKGKKELQGKAQLHIPPKVFFDVFRS